MTDSERPIIVVVDDERIVLDSVKGQLRHEFGDEYEYEVAESVEEAWEVIDELTDEGGRLVVVLTDWLMPRTRGDQFLADLKWRHPGVIRIMLTGHAESSALERVVSEELAHRLLFKPWSAQELTEAINAAATETRPPGG